MAEANARAAAQLIPQRMGLIGAHLPKDTSPM